MPEAYGWDTIETAEELYILDGLTFEQVAERTGVSISQLKRWSADSTPSWPDRRREYRSAQTSVRRGVMLAKAKLIESVIDTEDAQKAYAFGSLVNSGLVIDREARERIAAAPVPAVPQPIGELVAEVTDPIAALREAVKLRTAAMLQVPGGITIAAIKELMQVMEMLEKKAASMNPDAETKSGGLTEEAAETIRRQILGLRN